MFKTHIYFIVFLFSLATTNVFSQSIIDVDGNMYKTIKLGDQLWMTENLKTTRLNDSSSIQNINDNTAWSNLKTAGFSLINKQQHEAVYNGFAIQTNKLCPIGWHVPTDTEWSDLETFLITQGYTDDASTKIVIDSSKYTRGYIPRINKIAKSMTVQNSTFTSQFDKKKHKKCGFAAVPTGFRLDSGQYTSIESLASWWSFNNNTLETNNNNGNWNRTIRFEDSNVERTLYNRNYGFSVRCMKTNN